MKTDNTPYKDAHLASHVVKEGFERLRFDDIWLDLVRQSMLKTQEEKLRLLFLRSQNTKNTKEEPKSQTKKSLKDLGISE